MFIFSNLAMTLDGKIAPGLGEFKPFGTKTDWKRMLRLRDQSDAILWGASTLRDFKKPHLSLLDESLNNGQKYHIVLSSSLDGISLDWPFFKSNLIKRILFVTENISKEKLNKFSKSSVVILLKKSKEIGPQIVRELKKKGIKRLLVEGGGKVMWHFVSQNLIDEYYVTLTPRVLGGSEAPTLIDGVGFSLKEMVNLKLIESEILKNEIYLRYKKTSRRGL